MSDRTAYTVKFASFNELKSDEIQEYLDEMLGGNGGGDSVREYIATDVPVGGADEIALGIQELDPTATFKIWEDPKYEWLGTVVKVSPRGRFMGDCDAGGHVVLGYEVVKDGLRSGKTLEQIFGEDIGV